MFIIKHVNLSVFCYWFLFGFYSLVEVGVFFVVNKFEDAL
jgi:hypothetical protein